MRFVSFEVLSISANFEASSTHNVWMSARGTPRATLARSRVMQEAVCCAGGVWRRSAAYRATRKNQVTSRAVGPGLGTRATPPTLFVRGLAVPSIASAGRLTRTAVHATRRQGARGAFQHCRAPAARLGSAATGPHGDARQSPRVTSNASSTASSWRHPLSGCVQSAQRSVRFGTVTSGWRRPLFSSA